MSRSPPHSIVVIAGVLAACHAETPEKPERLPAVQVLAITPRLLAPRIAIAGVLAPLPGHDIKVGALVAGRVDRVFVAEGDVVRVGQVLAHIEAQPLQARVTETDAQKTQASATLENARTKLARSEKLWKDGISSRQEVDDARATLVAAESALKAAQAIGGSASVQLDRATLRAPIAGVVAAILVPAGQPVDGSGMPVIQVADTKALDLRAPVPAGRIGAVTVGMQAELLVEGVGAVVGQVVAIAPLVETATNTVMVRVHVANADGRLRGGIFSKGALLCPQHQGLAVPKAALLPGEGGTASKVAIVLPDGTVAHRDLRLGPDVDGAVEVLSGLSAGDRVIIAGGYTLPDGAHVEITP